MADVVIYNCEIASIWIIAAVVVFNEETIVPADCICD